MDAHEALPGKEYIAGVRAHPCECRWSTSFLSRGLHKHSLVCLSIFSLFDLLFEHLIVLGCNLLLQVTGIRQVVLANPSTELKVADWIICLFFLFSVIFVALSALYEVQPTTAGYWNRTNSIG